MISDNAVGNRQLAFEQELKKRTGVRLVIIESTMQKICKYIFIKDLTRELERYYSPVRAEMIAVTETTRSVVQGEREAVWQMQKESGLRMIPIWLTAQDDRVCPICGPRHKQVIEGSNFPPAHPRCRCGVAYEYPKEVR